MQVQLALGQEPQEHQDKEALVEMEQSTLKVVEAAVLALLDKMLLLHLLVQRVMAAMVQRLQ